MLFWALNGIFLPHRIFALTTSSVQYKAEGSVVSNFQSKGVPKSDSAVSKNAAFSSLVP